MDAKITKQMLKDTETRLTEEKQKTLHQIQELKKNDPFFDPDYVSDNAAVDTDAREQIGHQTIEAQISDLNKRVADIDITLNKITKGKYGVCEKCNKDIPFARLQLIPEARYCVSCENKLRK